MCVCVCLKLCVRGVSAHVHACVCLCVCNFGGGEIKIVLESCPVCSIPLASLLVFKHAWDLRGTLIWLTSITSDNHDENAKVYKKQQQPEPESSVFICLPHASPPVSYTLKTKKVEKRTRDVLLSRSTFGPLFRVDSLSPFFNLSGQTSEHSFRLSSHTCPCLRH